MRTISFFNVTLIALSTLTGTSAFAGGHGKKGNGPKIKTGLSATVGGSFQFEQIRLQCPSCAQTGGANETLYGDKSLSNGAVRIQFDGIQPLDWMKERLEVVFIPVGATLDMSMSGDGMGHVPDHDGEKLPIAQIDATLAQLKYRLVNNLEPLLLVASLGDFTWSRHKGLKSLNFFTAGAGVQTELDPGVGNDSKAEIGASAEAGIGLTHLDHLDEISEAWGIDVENMPYNTVVLGKLFFRVRTQKTTTSLKAGFGARFPFKDKLTPITLFADADLNFKYHFIGNELDPSQLRVSLVIDGKFAWDQLTLGTVLMNDHQAGSDHIEFIPTGGFEVGFPAGN